MYYKPDLINALLFYTPLDVCWDPGLQDWVIASTMACWVNSTQRRTPISARSANIFCRAETSPQTMIEALIIEAVIIFVIQIPISLGCKSLFHSLMEAFGDDR